MSGCETGQDNRTPYRRRVPIAVEGSSSGYTWWDPGGSAQLARHSCHACQHMCFSAWEWIRTDLGVRTFQGLGKNSPAREQAVRRITRDLCTQR